MFRNFLECWLIWASHEGPLEMTLQFYYQSLWQEQQPWRWRAFTWFFSIVASSKRRKKNFWAIIPWKMSFEHCLSASWCSSREKWSTFRQEKHSWFVIKSSLEPAAGISWGKKTRFYAAVNISICDTNIISKVVKLVYCCIVLGKDVLRIIFGGAALHDFVRRDDCVKIMLEKLPLVILPFSS